MSYTPDAYEQGLIDGRREAFEAAAQVACKHKQQKQSYDAFCSREELDHAGYCAEAIEKEIRPST